jgi:hypothetical protein
MPSVVEKQQEEGVQGGHENPYQNRNAEQKLKADGGPEHLGQIRRGDRELVKDSEESGSHARMTARPLEIPGDHRFENDYPGIFEPVHVQRDKWPPKARRS